jgi:hypothetical protein
MLTLRRILATTTASLILVATSVGAQAPRHAQAHDGLWFGLGIGASTNDLDCSGCAFTGPSDPWRGGLGSGVKVSVGGALSQQLLLGGEISVTDVSNGTRAANTGSILFIARYYPGAFEGFHVEGGMGPSVFSLGGGGGSVEATGFSIQGGLGYDFRLGRRFALTPYASAARTMVQQGSLKSDGSAGPVTRLNNKVLTHFGLGFHWY